MLLMGIDPGLNAAAALLQVGEGGSNSFTGFVEMIDLETCADGEKRQIDVPWLCDLLQRWTPDRAVVENVQPMPSIPGSDGMRRSMGAASSFRFGMACGMIRATLIAFEIPTHFTHPQSWKRHFGFKGPDKKQGVEFLRQRYPETEPYLRRVRDANRADAGLLALHHLEKNGMV